MEKKVRKPHPALKDVLTVPEAATIKDVDDSSVIRAIQRGDLAGDQRQTGRKTVYLIHRRDLEAWTPERRGPKRRAADRIRLPSSAEEPSHAA